MDPLSDDGGTAAEPGPQDAVTAARFSPLVGWLVTLAIGAAALVGGHQLGRWLSARPATIAPTLSTSVSGTAPASASLPAAGTVAGAAPGADGVAPPSPGAVDRFATLGPEAGGALSQEVGLRVALGELAPDFSLPSPDGEELIALSDFRGRPVLVNFWATWCPPCRHEMPFLQQQYEARADIGLVVLAVDVGEEPLVVQNYLRRTDLTFPVVLDLFGDIADYYRIITFPTTVLIDREGRIASIKRGAYSSEADVARAVDALSAVAAPDTGDESDAAP